MGYKNMSFFQVGQRWMSEAEPELGLGMIVQVAPKTVSVSFPGSDSSRQYGLKSCPLKRVIFEVGESVESSTGLTFTVEKIEDNGGVLTYWGQGQSLSETMLTSSIHLHHPEEKLFLGHADTPELFDLRYLTLMAKKKLATSPIRGLMGGRIGLIPHQLYIANEIGQRSIPRVLLADEVGLGKTIEAGLILHQLLVTSAIKRVLIVVPDSLAYQWFVEMLRKFGLTFTVINQESYLEEGSNPFAEKSLVITGIDFLKGAPMALSMCQQDQWDLMIVDEAHQLKWSQAEASREYEIVETLAKKINGLLLLTATPEQLGKEGHFARLKLLDPSRFADYQSYLSEEEKYKDIVLEVKQLENSQDPKDLEKLKFLMETHGTGRVFFRNTRKSLVKEFDFFPKRLLKSYPLEFSLKENLDDDGLGQAFAIRAQWLAQFLSQRPQDKVLLICKSKKKVLALEKQLKETLPNAKIALFHSDLSLMARDRQAAYFAQVDGANILLCTEIGSEGRNFEFCHHLVLFDLPRNPDVLEQRIGRLDRIGQKADISIHVPYFESSWESLLLRWYNEGLNAFMLSPKGAGLLYAKLGQELESILSSAPEYLKQKKQEFDEFVARTHSEYQKIIQMIEEGRDILIEKNSFDHDKSHTIVNQIREEEKSMRLAQFMGKVFHHFGVDEEELDDETIFIRPGDNMFVPHFPTLSSEGVSATFKRSRACQREDIEFLTWDHPMVTGVMDLVANGEFGNVTICARKKAGSAQIYIEAFFMAQCVASPKLQVDRWFAPELIRVLIDSSGSDLSDKWPKEVLDEKITAAASEIKNMIKGLPKDRLKALLAKANSLAQRKFEEVVNRNKDQMILAKDFEIKRLRELKKKNPSVRQEEIDALASQKEQLILAFDKAKINLDSFRLIV